MTVAVSNTRELAEKAMKAIDKVVADKPERNGHDFSAAVCCLTELRERLLLQRQASPSRETRDRIARLNVVLSVIVGGEYPIGGVPWSHVESARDAFAQLLADLKAEA